MTADKKVECPRCHSKNISIIVHKNQTFPQCADCHFWSTKSEAFDPNFTPAVTHGG
jgi:transcription elongation factor Elf1